jgi:hypothetical protein
MVIGKIPLDFPEQKFFGLVIHFGHKIDHALIAHLMFRIVSRVQDRAGLARQIFQIG